MTKRSTLSLVRLLSLLTMVFICNPYISFFHFMPSDLQPQSLILACLWIALFLISYGRIKVLPTHMSFLACAIYALFISVILSSFKMRVLGTYVSLFVFSLLGYWMRLENLLGSFMAKASIYLNFFIGSVQYFYNKTFFTALVRSARTSHDRGVTGLAPEPSYYGISCLFLMLFLQIFYEKKEISKKHFYFLNALLLVQLIVYASSMTSFIPLGIWVGLRWISVITWRQFFLSVGIALTSGLAYAGFLAYRTESRFMHLLQVFLSSPEKLLSDASANDRISDILYSLLGFYEQRPIPLGHGLDAWEPFRISHSGYFEFIWRETIIPRIMSGYGSVLFEIGILGLIIPISVLIVFWRTQSFELKISGFALFFSMFFAIPLATPLYGVIIGFLLAFHHDSFKHKHHPLSSEVLT